MSQISKDRGFYVGTIVRHFKGKLYRIESFAKDANTGELVVIYRQMEYPGYCFVRPEIEFCSPTDRVKHPNAIQDYRFVKYQRNFKSAVAEVEEPSE